MFALRYEIRKSWKYLSLERRNFSCSSCLSVTHYQILGVNPNSSSKEIRDAYLKLCKKFHPDVNKDPSFHERFVRIKEAYDVLGKVDSRLNYNISIEHLKHNQRIRNDLYKNAFYGTEDSDSNMQSYYYVTRDGKLHKQVSPDDENYYGVKGVKRVSNGTLLIILVLVSIFAGSLQILTIRKSLMSRERDIRNEQHGKILENIRHMVATTSKEEQIAQWEEEYAHNLERSRISK